MTRVAGTVQVPGDKSLSHRALMLAALGDGPSLVRGILQSADVQSTASVLRALGVDIPPLAPELTVAGVGLRGLRQPTADLDCGNSGTSVRLLAGIVAGAGLTARFVGDASLSRRPMRRVAAPLELMGARVELAPLGGLPMTVTGGPLRSIRWRSQVASAQVKSAVLLAGLVAGVEVEYDEPVRSRDHTERMLAGRDVPVAVDGTLVRLSPPPSLRALDTTVPGDPSSAAFFAGLAAAADEGALELANVCVNDTRIGFLRVLCRMGASVTYRQRDQEGGEWVSPVRAAAGPLRAVEVGGAEIPALIDELPLLACIATRAAGTTVIRDAGELRVKESDRIAAVVSNLRALGADAEELPDGMRVTGSPRPLRGRIATHMDHRLAMAFGILGALGDNAIEVDRPDCVDVSYPSFWSDLARVVQR